MTEARKLRQEYAELVIKELEHAMAIMAFKAQPKDYQARIYYHEYELSKIRRRTEAIKEQLLILEWR